VRYSYRGLFAEPTKDDWTTGIVASFTGPLSVRLGKEPEYTKKTCYHVSASNLRWLRSRGRYAPKHILDLSALPADFVLAPSTLFRGAGVLERTDSEDDEEEIDRLATGHTDVVEPTAEIADESPAGPDTDLEADPGTGRRIKMPNAELDTEEHLGSEGL
jgi:hypothetical protein